MDDLTALRRARDLISDPARWTQREFARNAYGLGVAANSKTATCWCSLGAIRKVTRSARTPWRLIDKLQCGADLPVTVVNDSRTHADVLAMFDAAIARVSAQ